MTEKWAAVLGYEGRYEVSSEGRVRSLARRDRRGVEWPDRLLRTPINRLGYPEVRLSADNVKRTRLVHVLVLEAFMGPRPEGSDGCHNDGDPSNNTLANLRWDTHQANMLDASRQGRMGRPATSECIHGHQKDGVAAGRRYCKTCQRARDRKRRADQRAGDRAHAGGYTGGA